MSSFIFDNELHHPIECSDEYGLQGVADANDLASWINSWLRDGDSSRCVIEKVSYTDSIPLDPEHYQLTLRLDS